jgi:predicted metal-dependent phosphoesterase TrpH
VSSRFDAVEVINASSFPFNYSVKNAQKIASRLGIPRVAGSDAHYPPEIGYAYTLVDASSNVDEVVRSIHKGSCQPFGRAIPIKVKLKKELATLKRSIER